MKFILIPLIAIILSACATSPEVIKEKGENDQYLNCYQLNDEIRKAQHYKKEARKDDKFKLKYMMPLNAILSTININRAESSAIKRIKHLEEIAKRKGCASGTPVNNYNEQNQQQQNHPPQNSYQQQAPYRQQDNYYPEY